jgi:hypothetical protein
VNCVACCRVSLWQHDCMRASSKVQASQVSTALVEVDDICSLDPLPPAVAADVPHEPALEDTVEIELTAEQMDALLSGR